MIAGGVFSLPSCKTYNRGGKKSRKSQVYKEVNEDENEFDDSLGLL